MDPVKARPLPPQTPPGDGNSTPSALFRFRFFLLVPLTGLSGEYVRAKQLRCHRTRVTATAEERNARLSRPQPVMLPVCTLRSAESTTARTVAPRRGEPHAHARTHTTNARCAHAFTITRTHRRIAGRIRRAGFQVTLTKPQRDAREGPRFELTTVSRRTTRLDLVPLLLLGCSFQLGH